MATILAHITVKAGCEAQFEAVATKLYTESHEHETNIRRYEYWRGADERTYYTLLSFDDQHGFLAHQASDHHETASPEIGAVVESIKLEWVDPIASASPLAATNPQDAPEGADELTARYAETYAVQLADWWLSLR